MIKNWKDNRVEAALLPSTHDRPVYAVRRKIHYTGPVIDKGAGPFSMKGCRPAFCINLFQISIAINNFKNDFN